jgi:hypothetical protein
MPTPRHNRDRQYSGDNKQYQYRALSGCKRSEKVRWRLPEIRLPAISTIHAVLDRHGLVNVYRPWQTYKAQGTSLSRPTQMRCGAPITPRLQGGVHAG